MKFHVRIDGLRQPSCEQQDLLRRRQVPGMGQLGEQVVLVRSDNGSEWKPGEVRPRDHAHVTFQHIVPVLGVACHVERGEPDLVHFSGTLGAEEVPATVEPAQSNVGNDNL